MLALFCVLLAKEEFLSDSYESSSKSNRESLYTYRKSFFAVKVVFKNPLLEKKEGVTKGDSNLAGVYNFEFLNL
jgi:hypothetical protein